MRVDTDAHVEPNYVWLCTWAGTSLSETALLAAARQAEIRADSAPAYLHAPSVHEDTNRLMLQSSYTDKDADKMLNLSSNYPNFTALVMDEDRETREKVEKRVLIYITGLEEAPPARFCEKFVPGQRPPSQFRILYLIIYRQFGFATGATPPRGRVLTCSLRS